MKERSGPSALEYEILEESARTLGLAAKRMEAALAALAALPPGSRERAKALDDAVESTYAYAVQRDLLGFYDTDWALGQYAVPAEVRGRLGARRTTAKDTPER